jgi:hypothetical protein
LLFSFLQPLLHHLLLLFLHATTQFLLHPCFLIEPSYHNQPLST